MIDLSLVKSIIIINISGLNMPIKRQGTTLDLKKKKKASPKCMVPTGNAYHIQRQRQVKSKMAEKNVYLIPIKRKLEQLQDRFQDMEYYQG